MSSGEIYTSIVAKEAELEAMVDAIAKLEKELEVLSACHAAMLKQRGNYDEYFAERGVQLASTREYTQFVFNGAYTSKMDDALTGRTITDRRTKMQEAVDSLRKKYDAKEEELESLRTAKVNLESTISSLYTDYNNAKAAEAARAAAEAAARAAAEAGGRTRRR